MTRRSKINPSTYEVITDRARYAVTLESLRNTNAGCPRYKANIITLAVIGEAPAKDCFYTVQYTFTGHYYNEAGEAREIVRQHEEILKAKEE